jgi:hypothetical protein
VFENRVLRRIFGPGKDEGTGAGEGCIITALITWYHYCGLVVRVPGYRSRGP